jgi:hypothetical protein
VVFIALFSRSVEGTVQMGSCHCLPPRDGLAASACAPVRFSGADIARGFARPLWHGFPAIAKPADPGLKKGAIVWFWLSGLVSGFAGITADLPLS